MGHGEGLTPGEPTPTSGELAERVENAAAEIASSLDAAGGDEHMRHDLLHTLDHELGAQGVRVVDTTTLVPVAPELRPEALNGRRGFWTGRTRPQVLADLALLASLRRRRRP